MVNLNKTLAQIPGGGTSLRMGTARWDGERWLINDAGNMLEALWLDPIVPAQDGNIAYMLIKDEYGQSSALVLGGVATQPRPATGTVKDVIPAGVSTRLVITGEDGNEYTTDRFVGSYAVGDPVLLEWSAGAVAVYGKIGAMGSTPPPPESRPPAAQTGAAALVPVKSDTWSSNGWGAWAGSTNGREKVYTGTQSGYTVTGSWFYGDWGKSLSGLNILQLRFRIPARQPGTGSSGAVNIDLYAHTSGYRPGGDVNRVAGPFRVTLPAGYDPNTHRFAPNLPPGRVILPFAFHAVIAAGGGISIAGADYTGLLGRLDDGSSGLIDADWSTL